MAKEPFSIDLLQKQKGKNIDRVINWSLTIGRVLVIVTEFVALAAFLYRFSLDQQLIDLHTKIKQEQAIVAYFKKNEDTYRNLQNRLSLASSLISTETKREKIFEDVLGFAPQGLTFNTVSLYPDRVQIQADINSVNSLSVFVNALRSYPPVANVSIDKIENKTSASVITVTITASLKPEDTVNATTD
jgi:hypothetical protein